MKKRIQQNYDYAGSLFDYITKEAPITIDIKSASARDDKKKQSNL